MAAVLSFTYSLLLVIPRSFQYNALKFNQLPLSLQKKKYINKSLHTKERVLGLYLSLRMNGINLRISFNRIVLCPDING